MKSNAEYLADCKARKKATGLIRKEFWVTDQEYEELKKLYLRLVRRRKGDLLPR